MTGGSGDMSVLSTAGDGYKIYMCVFHSRFSRLPVLGHADNAVFLGDDDRRAHNILESLDFAQQTWLPSLRLGLYFGRHVLVVVHKPPSTVLAPGNITRAGPTAEPRIGAVLARCQQVAHGVVTAAEVLQVS